MKRLRANANLWAVDYLTQMLEGLRENRTVTRYVLEPKPAETGASLIEFELVVTKIGEHRLPRVVKP